MALGWSVSYSHDPCSYGERVKRSSKEFVSLEDAMAFAAQIVEEGEGTHDIEIEEVFE
jgi:hypothetical protein